MEATHERIEAVIFDWAGTTVDFGSRCPTAALLGLFEDAGVPVTVAEARQPMGVHKREHIRQMLADPGVAQRWRAVHRGVAGERDIDDLYERLTPRVFQALPEHAELIPGLLSTVAELRRRGIAIGSTTGYVRSMMEILAPLAAAAGYAPDVIVCASDVPRARPAPAMALANAVQLGVGNVRHCVKVDDTVTGIEEGLNAGMWTVGVTVSGNEVGLSRAEWRALDPAGRRAARRGAEERMLAAGAHFVIDSVADLPQVLSQIECGPRGSARLTRVA